MRFREHRGGLSESMDTAVELNDKFHFMLHVGMIARRIIPTDAFTISFSRAGFDERIGWDTYYVILEGQGPIGMIDGPPPFEWWPKAKFEFDHVPEKEKE